MAKKPEQFIPDTSFESLRKELDSKIEKRVHNHVFYWVCGLATLVIASLAAYCMKTNEAQNKINIKIAVIEDRLIKR